jgi:hypothetical protein
VPEYELSNLAVDYQFVPLPQPGLLLKKLSFGVDPIDDGLGCGEAISGNVLVYLKESI